MLVGRLIRQILAQLPAELVERLAFVKIEHRDQPNALDLSRGVGPDHRGYFYGHEVELDPGSSAIPDERPPTGEIVIFTGRIKPLTLGELARVLLHEIGHALGHDHDVLVDELGLA